MSTRGHSRPFHFVPNLRDLLAPPYHWAALCIMALLQRKALQHYIERSQLFVSLWKITEWRLKHIYFFFILDFGEYSPDCVQDGYEDVKVDGA